MSISLGSLSFSKAFCIVTILFSAAINIVRAARFARSESKIVDGINVTPLNKYPMLATLFKQGEFYCSCTILNKYYVLTETDCAIGVDKEKQNYRVVAGIYYLGEPDTRYIQNISVRSVTYHVRYNDKSKGFTANNIAVVKLSRPLVWNDHVAPTNLPVPGWTVLPNTEIKGITAGWGIGRNRTNPYSPARPLQEVELPLLTTEDCQRRWNFYGFNDDQVCIEVIGGAGPCDGDDGGPLFIYNEADDKHIQVGIFAFVDERCGNSSIMSLPAGFTKISKFNHWIDEAVRECNPTRVI